MTDFRPGDVALVNGRVCMNTGTKWAHADPRAFDFELSEPRLEIRPLCVIDPEDAAQVRRLADIYAQSQGLDEAGSGITGCITTALREFARPTPAKPEEPTGLGAVVETTAGKRWVRVAWDADDGIPWAHVGGDGWSSWADLPRDVRVIASGLDS